MPHSDVHRLQMASYEQVDGETVPLASLVAGDTLRIQGTNEGHVRVLAETEGPLPPILVHRHTLRVIDGMHRLLAAKLQGRETIAVRFFEGDEEEAFVAAVQANAMHGLPLTLADRRTAAARIVRTHAEWSDRMIAGLVGLSPKTVGVVRRRLATEEFPQSAARVGRDGRIRQLPTRKAKDENVPTSDRGGTKDVPSGAMARSGQVSHAMHCPPASSREAPPDDLASHQRSSAERWRTAYQVLRQDPSVRMTEAGRFLLRLLDMHLIQVDEWERLTGNVPPHRAESVAALAVECAKTWHDFAARVTTQGLDPGIVDTAAGPA